MRKVIYDYNSISNRLLKAEFEDYKGVLKKFLTFISDCPVIRAYLEDCGSPTIPDIAEEVNEVVQSHGDAIFITGDTPSEETANILAILLYLADSDMEIHYVVMAYSDSGKFNDIIKSFNERFVVILIRHIEGYLTKMGIDMGLDEKVKYNITVTNGQVNLANDNGTINAVFNNGVNQEELKTLLASVLSNRDGLAEDEAATVAESVDLIESELKQENPKKNILRGVLKGLQAIKGSTEFLAAVATLVQFVQTAI